MQNSPDCVAKEMLKKVLNAKIASNVAFACEQIQCLKDLNNYGVKQVMYDYEVRRDPRKLLYKTNQEMHMALTAFCLSQALTNLKRGVWETLEFFRDNIIITTKADDTKFISFEQINPQNVLAAISPEIVEDWKIYR